MKRKITLLLLAAASVLTMNSQVVLNEGFTSTWNPAATGWSITNQSSPVGTLSWVQGNTANFDAYNGGVNDYYAVNYQSVLTAGTISNWLITPDLTLMNGAVFQFATKTVDQNGPNFKPDRLQLRMTPTTNTALPVGATGVGGYSSVLFDINPNLNTNTTTAVTSGTMVDGYPNAWTVYSVTVSGITGTITGKFAFRYFVTAAGTATNTNGNYIGIDAVKYTLPCGVSAPSFTTCANQPISLVANGGLAATNFSWTGPSGPAGNTQTINVIAPASGTAVYTLTPGVGTVACSTSQTATVTVGSSLSMSITSNLGNTVCAGQSTTLTVSSGASSYSWNPVSNPVGPTNTQFVVTPTGASTTYTVAGSVGGSCFGGNTITIATAANPTLGYSQTGIGCSGSAFTLNALGNAVAYDFFGNFGEAPGSSLTLTASATPGIRTFTLLGQGANGCLAAIQGTYAVNASPTITAVSAPTVACKNRPIDITASGAAADTYTFVSPGAITSTNNPLAYATGTAGASVRSFTISGKSDEGCIGTTIYTLQVYTCTGIESVEGNATAAVFPNPFSNELNVSGLSGNVEIFNALGQIVIKATVSNNETVNTADLTKGIYILKAYNTNGEVVRTVKLLKN